MQTSEKVDKILPALATVKAKLQAVTKGANNPFFKSKYADLNTHLEAVEPLLEENGLVLFQPVQAGESNVVESIIVHSESGQFVLSSMKLVGETDMQKVGSGITYARRYTLGALLSMKAEDDDGEGSMVRAKTSKSTSGTKSNSSASFRKPKKTTTETVATGDDI